MGSRAWDAITFGPARRRRWSRRRMRELERLEAGISVARLPAPRRPRGGRRAARSMRGRARTAVAGFVGLLGLSLLSLQLFGSSGTSPDFPDRPPDAQSAPIGQPPDVADAGTYAFTLQQSGGDGPVTYDPCTPIHVVVNDRTAVKGSSRIVREALDRVSRATGLSFVVDGSTDRAPSPTNQARPSADAWPPVLIAWSDPDETPGLKGRVVGLGGSAPVRRGGHEWYVTGGVTLDGPQLRTVLRSDAGRASVRAVIMHELGHVVGLKHVKDRNELMFAQGTPDKTEFGPGDRAGLAALGAGRCIDY